VTARTFAKHGSHICPPSAVAVWCASALILAFPLAKTYSTIDCRWLVGLTVDGRGRTRAHPGSEHTRPRSFGFDHLLTLLVPALSRECQKGRLPESRHEPRNAVNAAANAAASCGDRRAFRSGCRPAKCDPTQLSGQIHSSRRRQMRGHSAGICFCAGQQHDQDVSAGAAPRSDTSTGVRSTCMIYMLLQHVPDEYYCRWCICVPVAK
jgi:hypothetical protein